MKSTRRLALLSVVLACAAAHGQGPQEDEFAAPSRARGKAREERIKFELAQLSRHEWAGEYYYGDGLGVNVSLLVAPKAGFAFTWRGCVGVYGLNYGGFAFVGNRLKLFPELPNRRGGFGGIDTDLVLVAWGDRRYLVPSHKLKSFANAINAGMEPRKGLHGGFLLRVGDERRGVRGKPGLPAESLELIVAAPIEARISAVGESRVGETRGFCDKEGRTTTVTLSVGSTEGVKAGMDFYSYSPKRVFETVTITKVTAQSSQGVVELCSEHALPTTAWKLCTKLGGPK